MSAFSNSGFKDVPLNNKYNVFYHLRSAITVTQSQKRVLDVGARYMGLSPGG